MLIRSNSNLHYPITVTKLLVKADAEVARFDILFTYTYTSKVIEGDKYGDEREVERTFPAEFKSETDGTVTSWKIKEGDVLAEPGIAIINIEEPCTHEETFGNLCVNCGVDVTQLDNYLTSVPNENRATISTAHTNTALKISQRLANTRGEEATRRLLDGRKLSLVVDLDQTIIHATVDPTVAEWQNDPQNPNHEAVKSVQSFQLVDDGPDTRKCWYYIKLRPGLEEFLEAVSQKYELHIYTMGTRAYAQNIAKIVDPSQRFFADRILSRDESGSLTFKSLQRLFPTHTEMVVIIDDRGDVWNWSPNLIKVTPYDFFVGIGDINASFLPKQDVVAKPAPEPKPVTDDVKPITESNEEAENNEAPNGGPANNEAADGELPPEEATDLEAQLVAMAGGDTDAINIAQEEAIAAQLEDRPLLKKQEALDKLDENEENLGDSNETSSVHSQRQRHHLLHDDDEELKYLQINLEEVHKAFFTDFDRLKGSASNNKVAELRGEKTSPKKPKVVDDLEILPDVKTIMPSMKNEVLRGVVICFTGVIPQGIDHATHDLGRWAISFGARINVILTKATTHVIAHKDRRTSKARQAARYPRIQIVSANWLYECFIRWSHVEEYPYTISYDDEMGGHRGILDELEDGGVNLTPSDDGGDVPELPNDPEGSPVSPVDWEDIDAELNEFMGSEYGSDFDEGSESDASDASGESGRSASSSKNSTGSKGAVKRKRSKDSVNGDTDTDGDDGVINSEGSSHLQKRKKRALERSTGLAHVTTAQSSGLPSPEATGPDEENEKMNGLNGDGPSDQEDEDDDDELERGMWDAFNDDEEDEEEGV